MKASVIVLGYIRKLTYRMYTVKLMFLIDYNFRHTCYVVLMRRIDKSI